MPLPLGAMAAQFLGSMMLGERQRELQMEDRQHKLDLLKLQEKKIDQVLSHQKILEAREARKDQFNQIMRDAWLADNQMTPNSVGPTKEEYSFKFGSTFDDQNPQAPRQSKLMQLLQDPEFLGLAVANDVDLTKVSNFIQATCRNTESERQHDIQNQIAALETMPVTRKLGDGTVVTEYIPKYPGLTSLIMRGRPVQLGGATAPGVSTPLPATPGAAITPRSGLGPVGNAGRSFVTEVPQTEQPLPYGEWDNWVKPGLLGLERPDPAKMPNVSAKGLAQAGFIYAPKEQQTFYSDYENSYNILNRVQYLTDKVYPKYESLPGRVTGGFGRWLADKAQTDPDVAELKRLTQTVLSPLARQMGEKGALADKDAERAASLFADLWDSGQVARRSISSYRSILDMNGNAKLGRLNQGDHAPARRALPAAAVGTLKEGHLTEFENGQIWKLMNGVPIRVK